MPMSMLLERNNSNNCWNETILITLHYFAITATSGRIIDFVFKNATNIFNRSLIDHISELPGFAGNQYLYGEGSAPGDLGFANSGTNAFTTTTEIDVRALNLFDATTVEPFFGPFGINFSPVNIVSV